MAKKQWFLLGAVGALVGMAVKLIRGRREEHLETGRWETDAPPQREPGGES